MVLLVFQRRDTMKTKKTHGIFWFFDAKTKKDSVKPKNQKSSRNQKILSQILVFWFLVSGGFAESQYCGKQA